MTSLKKNFIYNAMYQVLIVLFPIITAPYISRVLGASKMGFYSYTYSVAYYFLLAAKLGLDNYGNRSISRVRDDKDKINQVFSSIYNFQFFIAVFFSGVIPPKVMTFSLITPSFPALVSCSGENAERYPFFDMLSKMGLKNR